MSRYIGLDVHSQSTALAVLSDGGRRLNSAVLPTAADLLIAKIQALPKPRHLVLEEGTQSAWLAEVLKPHVQELVVTVPRQRRDKAKNDVEDAFSLAEALRRAALEKVVFKSPATALRELLRAYVPLTKDLVRAKNRFRALLRSRGVKVEAKDPYEPTTEELQLLMTQLPEAMHVPAEAILEQIYWTEELRDRVEEEVVAEARKHPDFKHLDSVPGVGPIRAAKLLAIVVTPTRFRQSQQFWSYCGLGIQTEVSGEYRIRSNKVIRVRDPLTRGLRRGNPHLKCVFMQAAKLIATRMTSHPLNAHYRQLVVRGLKERIAVVTLARKLAAITLAVWKNKEAYDPKKHYVHS
jgi:transposase